MRDPAIPEMDEPAVQTPPIDRAVGLQKALDGNPWPAPRSGKLKTRYRPTASGVKSPPFQIEAWYRAFEN